VGRHLPMRMRHKGRSRSDMRRAGQITRRESVSHGLGRSPRTLHTRGACPSLIGSKHTPPRPPSHRAAAKAQRRDDYILITRACSRLGLRPRVKADVVFDEMFCIMNLVLHSRPSGSPAGRWAARKLLSYYGKESNNGRHKPSIITNG
jgi:hypothetical protein